MARLFIPLVFGLILFVVWLFAVLDVISTDEMLMRNLPKLVWLFIVVLFPTVGAIAWFAVLFTGRWPAALLGWVMKLIRVGTRVNAYMFLLTNEYPPFETD